MEVLQQILQQLINGISLGSIYALIALGYTMIYGIIKLINFAHGDIYMVGAYLGFYAITLGIPVVPAILISMAVTSLLGVVVERLAYRPLRRAAHFRAHHGNRRVLPPRVRDDGDCLADAAHVPRHTQRRVV